MDDETEVPDEQPIEDRQLHHICVNHLTLALLQFETALEELCLYNEERYLLFEKKLDKLTIELVDFIHEIYDSIPGIPSREEVEAMLDDISTQNIAWLFQDDEDLPLQ